MVKKQSRKMVPPCLKVVRFALKGTRRRKQRPPSSLWQMNPVKRQETLDFAIFYKKLRLHFNIRRYSEVHIRKSIMISFRTKTGDIGKLLEHL